MNSTFSKISINCFVLILGFGTSQITFADNTVLHDKSMEVLEQKIFDQRLLESDWFKTQRNATKSLAAKTLPVDKFITEFNDIWSQGVLSHIRLDKTNRTASQIYDYVENMNAGDNASNLIWKDGIPIITLNSMMGQDTIDRISQFYGEIIARKASNLIIDLRSNKGGAFAIKPLLGHLISESLNVGGFITRHWFDKNKSLPTSNDLTNGKAFRESSLVGFWKHLESNAISKTEIAPMAPFFSGHVYVLIGAKTESAAEMAADALSNLNNVTLIGKKTAGKMLSQKMFDIAEGIQLSVPIANYVSIKNGIIEGIGVKPDLDIDVADALKTAIKMTQTNDN